MNNNDGFDVGRSIEDGLSRIFEYLPQVLGAALLLIAGYFIAVFLRSLARRALNRLRFDRALHTSPFGNYLSRLIESPSRFVGKVVFWIVWLGFISMAVAALNIPGLTNLVNAIYGYIPNIIAAIAILLVASAISAGSSAFVMKMMGNSPTAKMFSTIIPSVVMGIAVFMILNQLRIAPEIVNITYIAIMGTVSLGLALAFGLGGRDVAADMLDKAYTTGRENVDIVKQDVRRAKVNTKRAVNRRMASPEV